MRVSPIDTPTTVEIFHDTTLSEYPQQPCEDALGYVNAIAPLITINDQRIIHIPGNPADTLNAARINWPMKTFQASINLIYTARRLERTVPSTQLTRAIAGIAFPKTFGVPSIALISSAAALKPQSTTVHEVGHLFNLDHCGTSTCVMAATPTWQPYTHRKYSDANRARLEDLGLVDMQYTTSYDVPNHFCGNCKDDVEQQGQMWSLARAGYKLPGNLLNGRPRQAAK